MMTEPVSNITFEIGGGGGGSGQGSNGGGSDTGQFIGSLSSHGGNSSGGNPASGIAMDVSRTSTTSVRGCLLNSATSSSTVSGGGTGSQPPTGPAPSIGGG